MRRIFILLLVFNLSNAMAQIDSQLRYNSDERNYYLWNAEKENYDFVETEYEHSLIDIRVKGSKTNGYIAISLVDDGRARLFHGSIKNFTTNENNEQEWILHSKNLKSKLTFNEKENTFTYLYDSNDENTRYLRIFIFKIRSEEH
jgi:hypothetical protein